MVATVLLHRVYLHVRLTSPHPGIPSSPENKKNKVKQYLFCGMPQKPLCLPLLPLPSPPSSISPLFSLFTFSPPSHLPSLPLSLHGFPNHTTMPLTGAPLTDLPPSSFHWPQAWQSRFNADFSLAETWQVNLWVCCDLMPGAFEVSYSSVAYRTQKGCQVAIVKSYPRRGVVLVYNCPDVIRAGEPFWRAETEK